MVWTSPADVRLGSLAEIGEGIRDVGFAPNNGSWAAHPNQDLAIG
jgi:hypothetical protein